MMLLITFPSGYVIREYGITDANRSSRLARAQRTWPTATLEIV